MAEPRAPAALVLDPIHPGRRAGEWEVAPQDLRWLLRSGKIVRHLLRHPSARLLVDDLDGVSPPKAILASRLLTAGPAWIEDRSGRRLSLDGAALAGLARAWLRDIARGRQVLRAAARRVDALQADLKRA